MNSFTLKMIAIITMLIDHIGAVLFPNISLFRYIGRISFPIFCFLLVEGFYHTRNRKKYLIRLGIFAIISEIPFDITFYHTYFYEKNQNIFFTLCIGLIMMMVLDKIRKKYYENSVLIHLFVVAILIIGMCVSEFLYTDYSAIGILMIFSFYLFYQNNLIQTIALFVINGLLIGMPQVLATLAMIPITFYNGKKGPSMKYSFYIFYPVHLLILSWIRMYLG